MDVYDAISQFTGKVNEDLVCAIPDDPESAADTADKPPKRKGDYGRLALAIHEILTNDETPATLYNAVADFVCVASSGDTMQTFWTPPILEHMLEWSKTHSLDAMREKGPLNDEN